MRRKRVYKTQPTTKHHTPPREKAEKENKRENRERARKRLSHREFSFNKMPTSISEVNNNKKINRIDRSLEGKEGKPK
jgi:hypothetical protein